VGLRFDPPPARHLLDEIEPPSGGLDRVPSTAIVGLPFAEGWRGEPLPPVADPGSDHVGQDVDRHVDPCVFVHPGMPDGVRHQLAHQQTKLIEGPLLEGGFQPIQCVAPDRDGGELRMELHRDPVGGRRSSAPGNSPLPMASHPW